MIRVSLWTAVFLIVLRLCIGWHFAYEGYGKVKSAYLGKAAVNEKPFSSEAYFRESEGPFGRLIKSRIGDPDQEVVDRLTPKPVDPEALRAAGGDLTKVPGKVRFPAALEREWDDYFNRFVTQFRLDDEQRATAQKNLDQAKDQFGTWLGKVRTREELLREQDLTPRDPKAEPPKPAWAILKVKRKAPGVANTTADYDDEVTVAERAAELKEKSEAVKAGYAKMYQMGKDADAAALRAQKAEVASIRAELQKELDDQTKAMKDALARVLDTRVTAYAAQADNRDAATTLTAMLTPMTGANPTNPLGRMWDEYAAYVKDFSPGMDEGKKAEVDRAVAEAKSRFDRWLADQDMFTGEPLPEKDVDQWRKAFAAAKGRQEALAQVLPAPKKAEDKGPPKATVAVLLPTYMTEFLTAQKADAEAETRALVSRMQGELKAQSDALRTQVGTPLLGADRSKGYVPEKTDERWLWLVPKSWTLIDFLDWSTRWFLLVVGVLLMVGLFTRLSCFAAAGFLLLTVLTQPSLPWIPAPPNSEGNYLVVNKNVIEMVALLVLMTTRSGRWFGLDAIVSWAFGRRNRNDF